jgi:predicted metal-dependent phosphoesterase TrpH
VSAVLKQASSIPDLSVIAITDHDVIDGALEALDLAPRYGIDVVPGVEVSTRDGHLLALFIERIIPAGLGLVETIQRVGDLGGLCVAPHPFGRRADSLPAVAVLLALEHPKARDILAGVEVFNGGIFSRRSNRIARKFARHMDVARVGSSDAHVLSAIGSGVTMFEGSTQADLRRALEIRATEGFQRVPLSPLRLAAGWTGWRALRSLGWTASNAGPEAPVVLSRGPLTPAWPTGLQAATEFLPATDLIEMSS